jgi:hypothetical protein
MPTGVKELSLVDSGPPVKLTLAIPLSQMRDLARYAQKKGVSVDAALKWAVYKLLRPARRRDRTALQVAGLTRKEVKSLMTSSVMQAYSRARTMDVLGEPCDDPLPDL